MLNKKNLRKVQPSSSLKKEWNLECLITTSAITLLLILGIFMSHYNKDMFIGGAKNVYPKTISIQLIHKPVSAVPISEE